LAIESRVGCDEEMNNAANQIAMEQAKALAQTSGTKVYKQNIDYDIRKRLLWYLKL